MKRSRLPGFRLTLGATFAWLGLIVLIPLAGLFVQAGTMGWNEFWQAAGSRQAVAAYELTFGASLAAALVNGAAGLLIAWVLTRYEFPGKKMIDALIDIPFALPTAVTGLAFASIYSPNGWLGRFLEPVGIQAINSPLAVMLVLTFISLPFVVRTLQPVLEDFGAETEEAARSLGATRWQTFRWVILPPLFPALLTGMALAFARAVGEYGSVIFVSGNIPYKTEIASVLILNQLEQFRYGGAAAIAIVMLVISFLLNGTINALSRWSRYYE